VRSAATPMSEDCVHDDHACWSCAVATHQNARHAQAEARLFVCGGGMGCDHGSGEACVPRAHAEHVARIGAALQRR
jgi:hypothetical protein